MLTFIIFFLSIPQFESSYYRDLYHNTPTGLQSQIQTWSNTNANIINCNGTSMVQGHSSGSFTKTFSNLPPHTFIEIFFSAYIFGNWTSNDVLYFNNQDLKGQVTHLSTNPLCQDLNEQYGFMEVRLTQPHTTSSILVNITGTTSKFGFRELSVMVLSPNNVGSRACYRLDPGLISLSSSRCQCPVAHTGFGSCLSCPEYCDSCYSKGCGRCLASGFFNGTACLPCMSRCATCFGVASNCSACETGSFYFWNQSCLSRCPLLVKENHVGGKECYSPCMNTTLALFGSGCLEACPYGHRNVSALGTWICEPICENNGTFFFNGSCLVNCTVPLFSTVANDSSILLCMSITCPDGYKIMSDGSCELICPNKTNLKVIGNYSICEGICETLKFSENGTCNYTCSNKTNKYIDPMSKNLLCLECAGINGILPNFTLDSNFSCIKTNFSLNSSNLTSNLTGLIIKNTSNHSNSTNNVSSNLSNISNSSSNSNSSNPPLNSSFISNSSISSYYTAMEGALLVAIGVSGASSLITGSPSGFKAQISMMQYLLSLLFLNIDFPENVNNFISLFKVAKLNFVPNIFTRILGDLAHFRKNIPEKFYQNHVYSVFLENTGYIFSILLIFLIVHCLSILMRKIIRSEGFDGMCKAVLNICGISGMFPFVTSYSVLITISISLQFHIIDLSNFVLCFSTFLSVISVVVLMILIYRIILIKKKMSSSSSKKREMIFKKFEIFYDELRLDNLGVPNPYFAYLLLRDLVQFSLTVWLYHIPFLQILTQLLGSLILSFIIFKMQPYILKVQNYLEFLREGFLSVIYVFIFAIQAQDRYHGQLGLVVIILCSSIALCQFVGTVVIIILNIKAKFMRKGQPDIGNNVKNLTRVRRRIRRVHKVITLVTRSLN